MCTVYIFNNYFQQSFTCFFYFYKSVISRGGRIIDPPMHRDSLSNDSGSILRISEAILSSVFNQMCDDAVNTLILLASNSSHTYTTLTFRKIIFHKGWSELQRHSQASLHRMRCEKRELCLMLHLKCGSRFEVRGSFIRHILNYTGYNQ